MPADSRTYITLHDGMPEHGKIVALSDGAFRALIDLWCWCSRYRTDGHVPHNVWVTRVKKRARAELLVDMAHAVENGVVMHDYLEHQRSKAEIEQLASKRSAAGKLGGARSAQAKAQARWRASN